jgi:hypothetical protein
MASEDSDQILSGLAAIHALRDLRDLNQSRVGQMSTVAINSTRWANFSNVALLR